jgi:hypothetical protein
MPTSSCRGVRSTIKAGGVEITVYTQPLKEGETEQEKSFLFIKDEQLVVGDHLATIKDIALRFNGESKDTLAKLRAFGYIQERGAKAADGARHQVRWFIEPFGYAEATRAAQGGKRKRGTDILKILQAQGFTAAQGIGGTIFFATSGTEVLHRTYAYAPPVKRQANDKRVDNTTRDADARFSKQHRRRNARLASLGPSDVATYLTFNWRMKEAFGYAETLVDAIAGEKGVFKDIWESMKVDPNGPQIDIYKGLVNHLGTRATILSDVRLPVTPQSERLMALVEVTDEQAVANTVKKAFEKDPQAKKRIFREHIIWEITQDEGLAEAPELMIEGAGFVSSSSTTATEEDTTAKEGDKSATKEADQPNDEAKLPNMAISVYGPPDRRHACRFHRGPDHGQPTSLGQMDDYRSASADRSARRTTASASSAAPTSRTGPPTIC